MPWRFSVFASHFRTETELSGSGAELYSQTDSIYLLSGNQRVPRLVENAARLSDVEKTETTSHLMQQGANLPLAQRAKSLGIAVRCRENAR
jgi:hypothetical protein